MDIVTLALSLLSLVASAALLYFVRDIARRTVEMRDGVSRVEEKALNEARRTENALGSMTALLTQQQNHLLALQQNVSDKLGGLQTGLETRHADSLKALQTSMLTGIEFIQRQVSESLLANSTESAKKIQLLTEMTDKKLQEISGQVERRLSEGFEKTTATFTDVIKRLALIDEAQKKITELSGNVVSLQEILSDKKSRGAFGEVQLETIVRNLLPENCFKMQYKIPTQSSDVRMVDCMLFLPEPTGNVPVDAKFPLENYRRMLDSASGELERKQAEKQFKVDVKKHVQDISTKYIVPGHTSDGAIMFIPAEAVFAEIHAHHPDLVEEAGKARVWMASPTTLMAILTTARSVIKDAATRKQVHIIQDHLVKLSKDFERFQKRMTDLATHIRKAHEDVNDVSISARKITSHFEKIERVELEVEAKIEEASAAPLLG